MLVEDDAVTEPLAMYRRNPSPLALCVRAAKNKRPAAELLHQLIYRYKADDALRPHHGFYWVAQPLRCWEDEVAISKNQLMEALKQLKALGLIEKTTARVRHDSPRGILHVRLTDAGHAVVPENRLNVGTLKRLDEGDLQVTKISRSWHGRRPRQRGSKGREEETNRGKEQGRDERERVLALGVQAHRVGINFEEEGQRGAAFEEIMEIARLKATPGLLVEDVETLVSNISMESAFPISQARGRARDAYLEILDQFLVRAWSRWCREGDEPLLPAEALRLAVEFWWEYREGNKPYRDDWPEDFVPSFVVYKADSLYDHVVVVAEIGSADTVLSAAESG